MWSRQRAALAAGATARDLQREIKAALLSPYARATRPELAEVALAMADDIGAADPGRPAGPAGDPGRRASRAGRGPLPDVDHRRPATTRCAGPSGTRRCTRWSPGSELVELERCGHLSPLEQPAAVEALLQAGWPGASHMCT